MQPLPSRRFNRLGAYKCIRQSLRALAPSVCTAGTNRRGAFDRAPSGQRRKRLPITSIPTEGRTLDRISTENQKGEIGYSERHMNKNFVYAPNHLPEGRIIPKTIYELRQTSAHGSAIKSVQRSFGVGGGVRSGGHRLGIPCVSTKVTSGCHRRQPEQVVYVLQLGSWVPTGMLLQPCIRFPLSSLASCRPRMTHARPGNGAN
jgi:hypothetical protein